VEKIGVFLESVLQMGSGGENTRGERLERGLLLEAELWLADIPEYIMTADSVQVEHLLGYKLKTWAFRHLEHWIQGNNLNNERPE